jgi:hypothetical protein
MQQREASSLQPAANIQQPLQTDKYEPATSDKDGREREKRITSRHI